MTTDNASNFVKSFTKFHIEVQGLTEIIQDSEDEEDENLRVRRRQTVASTSRGVNSDEEESPDSQEEGQETETLVQVVEGEEELPELINIEADEDEEPVIEGITKLLDNYHEDEENSGNKVMK